MDYLHLQRGIGNSYYLCRLQTLDDDLFVARMGWKPFQASSPAESPKSVCRVPWTPGVMHRSSHGRRPDRKHGTQTQAIRRALLYTRNPTRPGGTPSGRAAAMGCPRSARPPLGPRSSPPCKRRMNEERGRRRTRVKEKR